MASQQKRPRRLWGSVKKLALKDGAIRYAAQIPKEGGGKETIGRFDTHDEASAALDAYMVEWGIVVESKFVWGPILRHAKAIVESYDTLVTLRQLFYRLVADGTLRNTTSQYSKLSSESAQARRDGDFPDLLDNTRNIEKYRYFGDVDEAIEWTARIYRRDRSEGQPINLYVGVEKRGLVQQLQAWFGDPFGIPILPLGGYASQTFVDKVSRDIVARTYNMDSAEWERKSILLYVGDFDPTGIDIDRHFEEAVGLFDEVVRVALKVEQIVELGLPENPAPQKLEQEEPNGWRVCWRRRRFASLHAAQGDGLVRLPDRCHAIPFLTCAGARDMILQA